MKKLLFLISMAVIFSGCVPRSGCVDHSNCYNYSCCSNSCNCGYNFCGRGEVYCGGCGYVIPTTSCSADGMCVQDEIGW